MSADSAAAASATTATPAATDTKKKMVRVWCDGCYDMMHYGHANSLRQAKALGDYLIVGVHDDESIRKNKGPPVMTSEERYRLVRACKWVDEVVESAPYVTQLETLEKYDCDFCVHGDDITTDADGNDTYAVVKAAGKYRECKRTAGVSTTDLVGRMLLMSRVATPSSASPVSAVDTKQMAELSAGHNKSSPYTGVSHFLPTSKKIIQFSEGREPKSGDKIVYIPGAFDLFHVGHVDILEKAAALGDFLIVGIYTDQDVNMYKGSQYPLQSLHERVLSVLACKYVDEVVIGAPFHVTQAMMDHFKVDIVVAGCVEDPPVVDGKDPFVLPRKLSKFRQVDSGTSLTTSEIVRRIIVNSMDFIKRNEKKEAKENARMAGAAAGAQ